MINSIIVFSSGFKILKNNCFIHKFFGNKWTPHSHGTPDIGELPLVKQINGYKYSGSPGKTETITDPYAQDRDRALNRLMLDSVIRNSNFVSEFDLNDVLDHRAYRNLAYANNALRLLELCDEVTWNLMKSKIKPFVICAVCNCGVDWNVAGKTAKNVDGILVNENHKRVLSNDR